MVKNFLCCFFLILSFQKVLWANRSLYQLKVNFTEQPLGIITPNPVFSWKILAEERNTYQRTYRILVSDSEAALKKNKGNIWDSGIVNSSQSVQVIYQGKPLQSAKTYFWKVSITDNRQQSSVWSEAALFQTGLFDIADWKGAQWIAYGKLAPEHTDILPKDNKKDAYYGSNVLPLFRKDFQVKRKLKRATVFVSGLGHFEMSLNGKKQGDHFLDAGWTKYDKEALYVTFDVTESLRVGENTLGMLLGNGFYYVPPVRGRFRKSKPAFGLPKMICRMVLEYKDGHVENIISDQSWRTSPSPLTFSSIYGGEDYNASLEQIGWNKPGFDDTGWKTPLLANGPPALKPQIAAPLKIFNRFQAREISEISDSVWIYDLGQNASGIISLKVKGKKGDTIRVYPGELLKNGRVNQKPTGSPYYFQYVLKGDGEENWQPKFTYYGFRYLEVRGGAPKGKASKSLPEILELAGLHTRNAAENIGTFWSSNTLFNQTNELINWAIKSNMASVFTDCPHREKLGWLEQSHLMMSSIMYNYDVAALCDKVVDDIIASQMPEGLIPEIAPEFIFFTWGGDMFRDSPEWGSTAIILPWYMYQWYGNQQVLEKAYPTMQKYITYLEGRSENLLLKQGLGDWYDIGPDRPGVSQQTPEGVTGTAIFYYDLQIMQKIAGLLGKTQDIQRYKTLATQVKAEFNKAFFHPQTAQYATGSQTANAMALFMGLVPLGYKEKVLANLIGDIRGRNNALTAGDIGYRYVLRVLENAGRSDVIYDLNSRSDVPGYGFQLAHGATALTESWQALPEVSNNHLMLGHLMEWFYSGLAGIRAAADAVAFNKIEINPQPVGELTSAKASFDSPYGNILSDWKKQGDRFELKVEVPVNTQAVIFIPAKDHQTITESGKNIEKTEGLRILDRENGKVKITAGSGKYLFSVN